METITKKSQEKNTKDTNAYLSLKECLCLIGLKELAANVFVLPKNSDNKVSHLTS